MKKYFKSTAIIVAILVVLVVGGIWALRTWYSNSLKPVSNSKVSQYFTVKNGASVQDIGSSLQSAGLIRSEKAFETYVRSNEYNDRLQAGTYYLSPSMGTKTIVREMVVGDVAKNLLTILPGKRLDQIEQAFKKAGYSDEQIAQAFSPASYPDHPALTSLPNGASLEGFLYPDSFQKLASTPAQDIVRESLDEMNQHLTANITSAFAAEGLSIYQGVTLASIVAQETDDPAAQPTVAQVFLLRLKQNMALGSDVTAYYASALAGQPPDVNIDSPYNTRLHTGLPPGPISNVTASALKAVAHPSNTSYLYFLAGDDKKLHFAYTEAQHEQNITQYCQKSCGH
ncbi:MAG TPA: endolytic transglycosylase MltG [Candidatus Saccharimonadales bacterium]|nr:endolytic transglycosylase MltG [Candidatus Saccharimonadales bacterium]